MRGHVCDVIDKVTLRMQNTCDSLCLSHKDTIMLKREFAMFWPRKQGEMPSRALYASFIPSDRAEVHQQLQFLYNPNISRHAAVLRRSRTYAESSEEGRKLSELSKS
jgi:hypothetical protein